MEKMAEAVNKLGQKVKQCYCGIEKNIAAGYKIIEAGAVKGFDAASDKCIEVLFAKEGESIEAAKERLNGGGNGSLQ